MSDEIDAKGSCLGLISDGGIPVPLKSVGLDIHIFCNIAEVTSTLTYFNEEDGPVEAKFTFPVDDGSCVFQFEAEIQGRHIKAEIQEKEQAVLTYKDAMEKGRTAMLLKEDDTAGDIFSCSLGNLPPKTEAMLTMKYVIELPQEPDGKFRFTLPTVLNPRYSPDAGGTVAAEGASYMPPSKVLYEFRMSAIVEGYFKIVSVTSEKDRLCTQFENDNKVAKITIAEEFKFDHDLQFLLQYEEPYRPQIVLEDGNPEAAGMMKEDVILMSFYPKLDEVTMATTGEYVFVIDRSGSMSGQKIQDAKEALLLFVKSLPPDCYFNIVSFGSSFKTLFSTGSKEYNEKSLETALDLIKKLDADMGGTEILAPLKDVFKTKVITGHARSVFVLTDGEVSNTDQVLGLVREQSNKSSTRVFSLGIGEGVSTSLVKGIARNGKGKAEFIAGGQRVQSKVVALLKCAMQPAITDLSLSWELPPDVTTICIPTELPSIITAGERLTLFAILQGVDKHTIYAASTVTLKGQHDNTPVKYPMTFTLCEADEIRPSAPVHRMATKAQIKLLQDQETAQFGREDDSSYLEPMSVTDVQSLRKKIIDLSCHGSVVSKYTAFVAIDTEGQKVEGKSVERTCPIPTLSKEFVDGYNDSNLKCGLAYCGFADTGVQRSYGEATVLKSYSLFSSSPKKAKKKGGGVGLFCGGNLSKMFKRSKKKASASSAMARTRDICPEEAGSSVDSTDAPSASRSVIRSGDIDVSIGDTVENSGEGDEIDSVLLKKADKSPKDADMMLVVSMQHIRGFWEYSAKLLQLLDISQEEFDKLDMTSEKDVITTLVALCWLRRNFSHRHEEWQMIEAKAKAWLSTKNLTTDVEDLIKNAEEKLWP